MKRISFKKKAAIDLAKIKKTLNGDFYTSYLMDFRDQEVSVGLKELLGHPSKKKEFLMGLRFKLSRFGLINVNFDFSVQSINQAPLSEIMSKDANLKKVLKPLEKSKEGADALKELAKLDWQAMTVGLAAWCGATNIHGEWNFRR